MSKRRAASKSQAMPRRAILRAMCAKIQRGILTASAQIAQRAVPYEPCPKTSSRIRAPHKAARRRILLVQNAARRFTNTKP